MVISGISYTIHYNKAPNQTWPQLFLLHKTVTPPISQNSFSASHFTSSPSPFFFINPPPSFHKTFQNQVGKLGVTFVQPICFTPTTFPPFSLRSPASQGGGRRRTAAVQATIRGRFSGERRGGRRWLLLPLILELCK